MLIFEIFDNLFSHIGAGGGAGGGGRDTFDGGKNLGRRAHSLASNVGAD